MKEFVKQFSDQAAKLWSALSGPQRVTLVVFLAGTVALVALVTAFGSQPDYVPVAGGLSPEETAAASAKLRDAQIPIRYEASRGTISVPSGRADDARLLLADLGLPSGRGASEGFELMDKNTFGMTDFAQKVNYLRALQGSLERKIKALDGVESAHVTLSIPENDVFARERQEAKASVEIKPRRGFELRAQQVAAIRHLVSAAVPKLSTQNVAVMDTDGRLLARFQNGDDALSIAGDQLETRMRTERYLTEKVESLLDQSLGPGRAAVQVAAQMDFSRVERSVKKMDPDSGVILDETTQSKESQGGNSETGGVPGVHSNTPGANGASGVTAGAVSSVKKEKTVTNRYHYDSISESVRPEVGALKRISVAVLIKPRLEGTGEDKKPVPLTDAELSQLTEAIKNAVGFTASRQDEVKVQNAPAGLPAASLLSFAEPAHETPPSYDKLTPYLSTAVPLVGVIVLAVVFWTVMRKMANPAVPASPPPAQAELRRAMTPRGGGEDSQTMQREIQSLVSQNSAQAADAIRAILKN